MPTDPGAIAGIVIALLLLAAGIVALAQLSPLARRRQPASVPG